MATRIKPVLDLVATVLMIGASASIIWFSFSKPGQAPNPSRPAPQAIERIDLTENLAIVDDVQPMGNANAPIAVVEFTDYQCPYCGRFARDTMPKLISDYIDTGKLRYAVRNFPIESIHPKASLAAVAAECAGRQQKYWPMHDLLFANQGSLDRPDLLTHASSAGVSTQGFTACLEEGGSDRLGTDLRLAQKLGVKSTPTFFIGRRRGTSIELQKRVNGAQPYEVFKQALAQMLESDS